MISAASAAPPAMRTGHNARRRPRDARRHRRTSSTTAITERTIPATVSTASNAETARGRSVSASGFWGQSSHPGSNVGSTSAVATENETTTTPDDPGEEAVEPRFEAAGGVRQKECREGNQRDSAEDESSGVDPRIVRLCQRSQKPEVSDRCQIRARAVVRTSPECDQAGHHERHARGDGEDESAAELGLVIACLDQHDRQRQLEGDERGAERERQAGQGRRAETRSPDSSPLATNPHAHDEVTSSP